MKTMTCKQLGGGCGLKFTANTFDQMAELVKDHGTEMFMEKDPDHLEAIQRMRGLMKNPLKAKQLLEEKKKEFQALEEDS